MIRTFQFTDGYHMAVLNGGIRYAAKTEKMAEDRWIEMALSTLLLPDDPDAQVFMEKVYTGERTMAETISLIFSFKYEDERWKRVMPRLILLTESLCGEESYLLPNKDNECRNLLAHIWDLISKINAEQEKKDFTLGFDGLISFRDALLKVFPFDREDPGELMEGRITMEQVRSLYRLIKQYYVFLSCFSRIYVLLSILVKVHWSSESPSAVMELRDILWDIEEYEVKTQ